MRFCNMKDWGWIEKLWTKYPDYVQPWNEKYINRLEKALNQEEGWRCTTMTGEDFYIFRLDEDNHILHLKTLVIDENQRGKQLTLTYWNELQKMYRWAMVDVVEVDNERIIKQKERGGWGILSTWIHPRTGQAMRTCFKEFFEEG